MRPETWGLVASIAVSAALVGLAIALQRGDRTLRTRLVALFVALSLAPSLLTLGLLWREFGPRARLQASAGVERSLEAALVLARVQIAARQAEAIARARSDHDSLEVIERGTARIDYDHEAHRVVRARGWTLTEATEFLSQPDLAWPAAVPAPRVWRALDSTAVALGIAASRDSNGLHVLVARPVPPAEAAAIDALVEGLQQSQRLGFLEDLRLATAARVLGFVALGWAALAIVLGAVLARSITRPIERLRGAFESLAGGELGHQVEPDARGEGELARLVQGFNRMSSELATSKSELVRTARLAAWQEVARRLAHEIKNPLTPITLSIHRLRRRTAEDPVALECFATILEETAHLERLANEFAHFARLPKPELQPVDAGLVLQQVLELCAAHPGVRLAADLEGLPAVSADRDQLRQVCTNVVKNAIEAMPEGGWLRVRWERAGDRIALLFDDDGAGLEADSLSHVFEPTFTTKPGGTGLGLAIVKRIVEDHGGSIAMGNRPEGGAWVRVELHAA